jgi:methionine synthase I (cobalamin-dependent)
LLSTTDATALQKAAADAGLNSYVIGKVGGKRLIFHYESVKAVDVAIEEVESAWRQALPKLVL